MNAAQKRILMAKTGLDGHWRGPTIVSRALRDAGFEVIMIGMASTEDIVSASVDEDVDLVGLNVGGHIDVALRAVKAIQGVRADLPVFAGGTIPPRAAKQLEQYFAGRRTEFELPLRMHGTTFQKRVWRELQRIPFGGIISYGELARRIGKPTASRAVGAANGKNPLSIVVPCHRVIGSSGSLVGFGGGLPRKERLLKHESRIADDGPARRPNLGRYRAAATLF